MIPEGSTARASRSPEARGSSAPRSSSGSCAASPAAELVLLIRPGRRSTVEQRARREIFSNNAFDRLREQLGKDGFAAMVAERVTPIAGDVGTDGLALDDDGRAAPRRLQRRHPLGRHGVVRLAARRGRRGEPARPDPHRADAARPSGVTPHLVSVSTCYVAGNRRGAAPEIAVHDSPFFIDVDWRGEVEGARRARTDAEADSRRPEALARFRKEARTEIGAAGVPALAGKTEQRRSAWVKEQMVEAGRARAASLGWPDAYAYTKALGERALLQNRGDVPVSIVRPSIIESSRPRAVPGLDPRLPHGRAGDHLLRPRAAEGVPGRARGDGRRDPGRPRRRRRSSTPPPGRCPRSRPSPRSPRAR